MLTRLKVSGFKNLVDVDVRFGPFTCVAGPNAAGKSNLFDAIRFLSAVADRELVDAALGVRDDSGRGSDPWDIFHRAGDTRAERMRFEVEMLIPQSGEDHLRQHAVASSTFLRYTLELGRARDPASSTNGIELLGEELHPIPVGVARTDTAFPHTSAWLDSVLPPPRQDGRKRVGRGTPFISMARDASDRVVLRHQDGRSGRSVRFRAADLPRTVLSGSAASESPTALLARLEMRGWRLLQLEPSALRRPDSFTAPRHLGSDGSHLAATVYHMAHQGTNGRPGTQLADRDPEQTYALLANRLAELIGDVRTVSVDRDERRELFLFTLTALDGTTYPARALSDGTLRFLALAVFELDSAEGRVLCLEEPENGVHPDRIPEVIRVLRAIATDPDEPVDADNSLRQVIINTHSPGVVAEMHEDELVYAQVEEDYQHGQRRQRVLLRACPDTWRSRAGDVVEPITDGHLVPYLGPFRTLNGHNTSGIAGRRRVGDRAQLKLWREDEAE